MEETAAVGRKERSCFQIQTFKDESLFIALLLICLVTYSKVIPGSAAAFAEFNKDTPCR